MCEPWARAAGGRATSHLADEVDLQLPAEFGDRNSFDRSADHYASIVDNSVEGGGEHLFESGDLAVIGDVEYHRSDRSAGALNKGLAGLLIADAADDVPAGAGQPECSGPADPPRGSSNQCGGHGPQYTEACGPAPGASGTSHPRVERVSSLRGHSEIRGFYE